MKRAGWLSVLFELLVQVFRGLDRVVEEDFVKAIDLPMSTRSPSMLSGLLTS